MAFNQDGRLLQVTTPLGANAMLLRSLRVHEAVSRPYLIEAELVGDPGLTPAQFVGKPVSFSVTDPSGTPGVRTFHGICRGIGDAGMLDAEGAAQHALYHIQVVPRWWLMSRTADCRAWQQKSAKDIVTELTGEAGAVPVRWGSLPSVPRPYTIQYNETDMDFCQRLLDEVGAGYWFEQKASSHDMVVCASNAEYPQLATELVQRAETRGFDTLSSWQITNRHPPAKVQATDYDLITPSSPLLKQAPSVLPTAGAATFETFNWPGGIHGHPDIDPAKLTMEQMEAVANVATATGYNQTVHAGMRAKVTVQVGGASGNYLITEVVHSAYDDTGIAAHDSTAYYSNQLTLIPGDRVFRVSAPRPRPVVPGLQSAIVVGQGEIDTDDKGRVLVRFLWDRKKQYQGGTSIRVRMVHPYAGAWGGGFFLPRIGDEVLVGFVDGDPDKPVIVGTLYNADGPPPWPLPANKTVAGMLSRSSEGGLSGDGFVSPTAADALTSDHTKQANIIRFNDLKGSEELYMQAQKDMRFNVKNDRMEYVGHDHLEEVKNDRSITVRKGNDTFLVDTGTQTTTIEGNHTTTIRTGNQTNTVNTGNQDNTVKTGNQTNTVSTGTQTTTVKGDQSNTVQSGNQANTVETGNQTNTIKMGNQTTKVDLGSSSLEAMQKITLQVGSNKIEISQMGIKIEGLMVTIKGSVMLEASSPLTTVKGDGMLTLKGGVVAIN
ncbi:MAG TPA: type VI secretion system tip protein TssI/VgrG [Roseomonas sp.]